MLKTLILRRRQSKMNCVRLTKTAFQWETDDSRKVRFAQVREASIELRESSNDPKST